jgi:hypothetical protein
VKPDRELFWAKEQMILNTAPPWGPIFIVILNRIICVWAKIKIVKAVFTKNRNSCLSARFVSHPRGIV